MEKKSAPDVHHNIIAAFPDTPILEFYKGYFECIHIILHSFMKCHDFRAFMNKEGVYTKDELSKVTDSVNWNDVVSLCEFKNIKQLDVALRNMIGGLNYRHQNDDDVARLGHICELTT